MRLRFPSLITRGASKAKLIIKSNTVHRLSPKHSVAHLFNIHPSSSSDNRKQNASVSRPPAIFAVIIGIDTYQDPKIPDLSGAVADADAVRDFLLSEYGVPKDRVVNLRNGDATGAAIVSNLNDLVTNTEITANDPILIYYAGHGSETKSPLPEWWPSANGKIQMLLPCDFLSGGSGTPIGQGVWDIVLGSVLGRIAHAKSDNITVILDCCHSGSGTRKVAVADNENTRLRGIDLHESYTIPKVLLQAEIESHRADAIPTYLSKTGLRSHILLASCQQGEGAHEIEGRGAFTYAFLDLIQTEPIDCLTYKDTIDRIKLNGQHPQCEGINQTRLLFNAKVTQRRRVLYELSAGSGPGKYKLSAGTAHGITNGAQFAVYAEKNRTTLLGTISAFATSEFTTLCDLAQHNSSPFLLPDKRAYAAQVRVGAGQALRVFVPRNDPLHNQLNIMVEMENQAERAGVVDMSRRSFRLVRNATEEPDLELSTNGLHVQFFIKDKVCLDHGLTKMPFDHIRANDTERLSVILRRAADFYWNLRLGRADPLGNVLTQKISLECYKLKHSGILNDAFQGIMAPDGPNLVHEGKIRVDINEKITYGFKIKNNFSFPIYTALFYYDMSDLSIEPYYLPGHAADGNLDSSVPARGSLAIGYGDSGAPARIYYLRENQNLDIGILKLCISTEYVDFSAIPQTSPFNDDERGILQKEREQRLWCTITIPIIQTSTV